jgi:hypothetical protein
MTSYVGFLIMMVTLSVIIIKMNSIEPLLLKHQPWYPYTIQLIGPAIICIWFLSLSYARNHGLRASVLREVKEKLSCNLR